MRGERERHAEMLLKRLQELGEWQETTERRLIAEQKQELLRSFPQPVGAENDTEDDTTVTSMEFDNDNDSELFDVDNEIDRGQVSTKLLNVSFVTENNTESQKCSLNKTFNIED